MIRNSKSENPEFKLSLPMYLKEKKLFSNYLFLIIFPSKIYADFIKEKLELYIIKYYEDKCVNLNCYKKCLPNNKEIKKCECFWLSLHNQKRDLLKYINWFNLLFALFSFVIYGISLLDKRGFIIDVLLIMFLLHFLSRSFEIVLAFYKDVVSVRISIFRNEENIKFINEWRSSSLQKSTRISLAVHSLLEVVVSFVIIYSIYFYFNGSFFNNSLENLGDTLNYEGYFTLLMYSFSVSIFNVDLIVFKDKFSWFIHIWQVGLSLNLIVLSLSYYLGMNNNLTETQAEYFYDLNNPDSRKKKT
jgi:hypothetical protein